MFILRTDRFVLVVVHGLQKSLLFEMAIKVGYLFEK